MMVVPTIPTFQLSCVYAPTPNDPTTNPTILNYPLKPLPKPLQTNPKQHPTKQILQRKKKDSSFLKTQNQRRTKQRLLLLLLLLLIVPMSDSIPSCFGELGSSVNGGRGSAKTVQNLTTCLYQTELGCATVTWCKNLMGQGLNLNIHLEDKPGSVSTCKVDMKPWFFWNKQGHKKFLLNDRKIEFFWDLSKAKFVSGPEPEHGFYVGIVCDGEMILLVGDLQEEAYAKTQARKPLQKHVLVSRREHVTGKKCYATKARFGNGDCGGRIHDISIECSMEDPRLFVRVDQEMVLQVKHLMWKFRGNERIQVDGVPVQVFWDVHNWLFNPTVGHAVFMFQAEKPVGEDQFGAKRGLVLWPSGLGLNGPEKNLIKTSSSSSSSSSSTSSVLEWASKETGINNPTGFSLLVYACKN